MEHAGFQHEALIYAGGDDYLAGTIPFLRGGLEAEEPALVAVGPAQTELLEGELGSDAKLIRFLPMEEVGRNPASIIPLWQEFVDEHGGRSLRGIGEPVWAARSAQALEECHRHEGLLNVAFSGGPGWSLLCPYDAESLPDDVLERVGSSHRHVRREGEVEESRAFEPDIDFFAGELPPPEEQPEVVAFGLEELADVRLRVAAAAERAGFDQGGVADLVTAASELAANSVIHGGGNGILRLWWEDSRLLAEVEDRGRIEEPLVGRLRPGVHQEGGRGLWLANQLCDLVQIRSGDGGTVVRLHQLAGGREPVFV
jgi:anti-sigma regulatory factor (Ser/Thr protein kinase)